MLSKRSAEAASIGHNGTTKRTRLSDASEDGSANGVSSEEVAADFKDSLSDLTINDRYQISTLTIIAKENTEHALAISDVLLNHIRIVAPPRKLPALYLLDSIVKNVGTPYTIFLSRNLFKTFMDAYTLVDQGTRKQMEGMLKTWKEPISGSHDPNPVFPIDTTRHIENALIRARTVFVEQQRGQVGMYRPPSIQPSATPVYSQQYAMGQYGPPAQAPQPLQTPFYGQSAPDYSYGMPAYQSPTPYGQPMYQGPPPVRSPQPPNPYAYPPPHIPPPMPHQEPQQDPMQYSLAALLQASGQFPQQSIPQYPTPPPQPPPLPGHQFPGYEALYNGQAGPPVPPPGFPGLGVPPLPVPPMSHQINTPPITSLPLPRQGGLVAPPPLPGGPAINDVKLTAASLKIPRPQLVQRLYPAGTSAGGQCSTCGRRFGSSDTEKARKQRHLDAHFRNNMRLSSAAGSAGGWSRSWFLDEREWIAYREVDDAEPDADSHGKNDGQQDGTRTSGAGPGRAQSPAADKWMPAPTDPRLRDLPCPICQDQFESKYDGAQQEWTWQDAVVVGEGDAARVYHGTCLAEMAGAR